MSQAILITPLIMYMYMISAFLVNHSHFLMSLLCLEGMILSIVVLLPLNLVNVHSSMPSLTLAILTMGACEASLGLSMMVKMSRHSGTDMLYLSSKNKC